MQVRMGQEGPGYMPWSSGTEIWVGWCYPYPRTVQVSILSLNCKGVKPQVTLPSHFNTQLATNSNNSNWERYLELPPHLLGLVDFGPTLFGEHV